MVREYLQCLGMLLDHLVGRGVNPARQVTSAQHTNLTSSVALDKHDISGSKAGLLPLLGKVMLKVRRVGNSNMVAVDRVRWGGGYKRMCACHTWTVAR